MMSLIPLLAIVGTTLLHVPPAPSGSTSPPNRFGLYYSGPPCPEVQVDRTYSQFQVNLARESELLEGRLIGGPEGVAVIARDAGQGIELVSNASRADWLLSYPFIEDGIGVWGRPILGPRCQTEEGSFYVEAVFPLVLLQGSIDPRLDLMRRSGVSGLQQEVRAYRGALSESSGKPEVDPLVIPTFHAAERLEEELFEHEAARGLVPWRVRLMGPEEPFDPSGTVNILLSGADGSTGMFGHIAVGGDGQVYNIYPKGSDRGAPDILPLGDYLFNAQRGMAMRRPTWILRLEGLPQDVVAAFDHDMRSQIQDIQDGRAVYHPTANNCTVASLRALTHLGFEVAAAHYFTRRFPRPAFARILERLPGLISSDVLKVRRVELIFVPQVPVRPSEGGAPNRPLRDRSRLTSSR